MNRDLLALIANRLHIGYSFQEAWFDTCFNIWKLGWAALIASPVIEISLCSYTFIVKIIVHLYGAGLAWLPRSRLKVARSRLPGWKISPCNTHKPGCWDESSKCCHKLLLTTVKRISKQQNCPGKQDEIFSYKHTRTLSHLPGCLGKRASPASTLHVMNI